MDTYLGLAFIFNGFEGNGLLGVVLHEADPRNMFGTPKCVAATIIWSR